MDAPLRVAIIGYGLAGRVFHAPLVAATPGMRVAAIVTGDPGRRQAAADAHPDARVHADGRPVFYAGGTAFPRTRGAFGRDRRTRAVRRG